jgi:hypothetical protein
MMPEYPQDLLLIIPALLVFLYCLTGKKEDQ